MYGTVPDLHQTVGGMQGIPDAAGVHQLDPADLLPYRAVGMPVQTQHGAGAQHAGAELVQTESDAVNVTVGAEDPDAVLLHKDTVLIAGNITVAVAPDDMEQQCRKAGADGLDIPHAVAEKNDGIGPAAGEDGDHAVGIAMGVGKHSIQHNTGNLSVFVEYNGKEKPAEKGEIMEFKQVEQELSQNAKKELSSAAESPEGRAVAQKIDDNALRAAAKRGDTAALKQMLAEVLSSPEGKALAEKVQKAVGKK